MRSLAIAALFAAINLIDSSCSVDPPIQYDAAIVGDSILEENAAHYERDGWLTDLQRDRQPFFGWGEDGTSSWQAVQEAIPLVAPDGWFIFEDNGLPVPDADWAQLLTDIVRLLPDDRCLLFVTTYSANSAFGETGSSYPHPAAMSHTRIMLDIGEAQPCHHFVRWDLAVLNDPALLADDGLHPTDLGSAWLGEAIDDQLGKSE